MKLSKALFAAGCFWGVQKTFDAAPGVVSTVVGYTGGTTAHPTYKDVSRGNTGHAEALLIEFDPQQISYEALLDIFFAAHDPTTKNRQGPDVGSQYRSAIFYFNADQEKTARNKIKTLTESNIFNKPIVTEVTKADSFYPAEEYHQKYYQKKGFSGCPR